VRRLGRGFGGNKTHLASAQATAVTGGIYVDVWTVCGSRVKVTVTSPTFANAISREQLEQIYSNLARMSNCTECWI